MGNNAEKERKTNHEDGEKKAEVEKDGDEVKKDGDQEMKEEPKANGEVKEEREANVDAKKEEVKEEDDSDKMDEDEAEPPPVALTTEEQQMRFRNRKQVRADLSANVVNTFHEKFSLPDDSEGFDEI